MRYFLYISYNGENYCGWQVQPNGLAVQEVVEKALSTLLRKEISVVGAGRTDAGVHALNMAIHFDSEEKLIEIELLRKLNSIFPKDITALSLKRVRDDAHARFDALSRTYNYYITTAKDPFQGNLKYRIMYPLDVDKINACAEILFEYEDFTSFSKLHTDVKTNNCEIITAKWEQDADNYVFTIRANRFLRNMVRAIVGTLLEVGRGKLDEEGFRKVIEAKDRGRAGGSVPGQALFLVDVEYPQDIFINQ